MQADVWVEIQAWLVAALVYPGLLFGVAVALGVEWVLGLVRPRLAPAVYRADSRSDHSLQPLFSFMRLVGRHGPAHLSPGGEQAEGPGYAAIASVALAGAVAPLLALALTPLGGNLAARGGGPGDIIVVLLLYAMQPLLRAMSRLYSGGLDALEGARMLGRLVTGLAPTLVAVAALVETSGATVLGLSQLGEAPQTAGQFFTRLLAGIALLAALPWWVDPYRSNETAGSLAGRHLQGVALGALWTVLVLPMPGSLGWAIALSLAGTIFATLVIRLLPLAWAPLRAEREGARLVWVGVLPVAALALLVSLV